MKIRKISLSLICVTIIIMGCESNPNLMPIPTATNVRPTDTPGFITPTPSLNPTETPEYTVLTPFVLTSVPTLEVWEEYSLLRELLRNDPPCQLPCWGGVVPGVSTVSEAEGEFTRLSKISIPEHTFFGEVRNTWRVGRLHIYYPLINTRIHISPGFVARVDNKIVSRIQIYTQSLPYKNSTGTYFGDPEYNALLSAYTMPEIFSMYGLPTFIYTRADVYMGEATAPDFFIIRFLYLDLGIFITYEMPMGESESEYKFCPSESKIVLEAIPQNICENYDNYFDEIGAVEWVSLEKTNHKLLEDSLGISDQEFSRIIVSSPATCFETPKNIWPDP